MGETLLTVQNLNAWYSEEKMILSGFCRLWERGDRCVGAGTGLSLRRIYRYPVTGAVNRESEKSVSDHGFCPETQTAPFGRTGQWPGWYLSWRTVRSGRLLKADRSMPQISGRHCIMKMTGKAFAKKLFGAKYERLPRTLLIDVIIFWGLYIAGFQVEIAASGALL